MRSRLDRSFASWCRRGDAKALEALEALFDRAAPRLLRLALHLSGDAAEAEDLVQQTFLALIEQRERVDASRPAWPWLAGVLAHKAADARRRAARRREVLGPPEDAHAPTPEGAEERELAAELTRALDRVPEPYRRPLVLHLLHDLRAPEIAHALDRSPATVRVQLHRGRELLKPLLPAALAGAALAADATAGLAAVRARVLRAAAARALPAGAAAPTFVLGTTVMSQKLLLAAVVALSIAGLYALATRGTPPLVPEEAPPSQRVSQAVEPDPGGAPGAAAEELVQPERASASPRAAAAVRGRVYDAASDAPLAGARLALHAPRELTPRQLAREHPELYVASADGRVRVRAGAEWPALDAASPRARFGAERVRVWDVPARDAQPIAVAVSDADGRYELPCSADGGVLSCELDGYAPRRRVAREVGCAWDVALLPFQEVEGLVVTASGEPPGVELELALAGFLHSRERAEPGAPRPPAGSTGVVRTRCDENGRFRARLAADYVYASALTAGWLVDSFQGALSPDAELRVVVRPAAVLRFFDAASGVAVERVRLLGRESADGYVLVAGEFEAPGGLLELPGAWYVETRSSGPLRLEAWAEGYAVTRAELEELERGGVREVALERGEVGSLTGCVRADGAPARGAELALVGRSALSWRSDDEHLIAAARADAAGCFELRAPAGQHLLRVDAGGRRAFQLVELPRDVPLQLDLDGMGRVDVFVRDPSGAPRAGHVVALQGDDGRSETLHTDAAGRVSFALLPPQRYVAFAPFNTTEGSFGADLVERFELAAGERRELTFELPFAAGPRRLRVRAGGASSYDGWRARLCGEGWQPVAADGTLPQDLGATTLHVLEVEAPDGRRWSLRAPRGAADGEVIELEEGGGSYRGELRGADGAALAGWRVYAAPDQRGELDLVPSVGTDAAGRFELHGLRPVRHTLSLRTGDACYDYALSELRFLPDAGALETPWLELRLPDDSGERELRGVVLGADGQPRAEHILRVEAVFPVTGGSLVRRSDEGGGARTGPEGRFTLRAPAAPRLRVRVWSEWTKDGLVLDETLAGEVEEPLELRLP